MKKGAPRLKPRPQAGKSTAAPRGNPGAATGKGAGSAKSAGKTIAPAQGAKSGAGQAAGKAIAPAQGAKSGAGQAAGKTIAPAQGAKSGAGQAVRGSSGASGKADAGQSAARASRSAIQGAKSGAGKVVSGAARAIRGAPLAKPAVAVAALVLAGGVAVNALASRPPSVNGSWSVSMQGNAVDGRGLGECSEHASMQHTFDVTGTGSITGKSGEASLTGTISGRSVQFQIQVSPPDGCNDVTELAGTITGNTVRGTYAGGDCTGGTVCSWDGAFHVEIQPNE